MSRELTNNHTFITRKYLNKSPFYPVAKFQRNSCQIMPSRYSHTITKDSYLFNFIVYRYLGENSVPVEPSRGAHCVALALKHSNSHSTR